MRLICPNCDAEYQVDDAAIPEVGRDVQCSNCGHAWFQLPADAEIAIEAEEELFGDAPVGAVPDAAQTAPIAPITPVAPVTQAAPAAAIPPAPPPPDSVQVPSGFDADGPELPPRAAAGRQTLAESVLSVLREEAARETAVRREEGPATRPFDPPGPVEVQSELGLDDTAQVTGANAAARHIARLKGTQPAAPVESDVEFEFAPKVATRRDLLPDIEEINSTLRANSERARDDDAAIDALPDLRARRSGFRSGFVLMMILAVVLALAYLMAPRIVAQMPGSEPAMTAYVASVDTGRVWLDRMMKSVIGSLQGLTGDPK